MLDTHVGGFIYIYIYIYISASTYRLSVLKSQIVIMGFFSMLSSVCGATIFSSCLHA